MSRRALAQWHLLEKALEFGTPFAPDNDFDFLEGNSLGMAARVNVHFPMDPSRDAEFDWAFELLRDLADWSAVDQQFPLRGPHSKIAATRPDR